MVAVGLVLAVVVLIFLLAVFVVFLVVFVMFVVLMGLVAVTVAVVVAVMVAVVVVMVGNRHTVTHYIACGGNVFHDIAALLSESEHYSGQGGCDAYVGPGGRCG